MKLEQLIERAQSGDEKAFNELVRLHQREVFRLALKLLGNYELARDASQETFLRAWRALPRFRGYAALSTWLHRITVNTSFNVRKRAQRHRATALEDVREPVDERAASPEAAGERIELNQRLRAALAQLTPSQRQVVVLKDIDGLSHAEVAQAEGISVAAAKVRLHRARRSLRDIVSRD